MVFSGLTFLLLFLPLFLLTYFVRGNIRHRNGVLVLFSLIFYAWGEPVLILVMLLTTLVNYLCALAMGRTENRGVRRLYVTLATVLSLASLGWFKYAGFVADTFTALTGITLSFNRPALPIGISFYTFQILTYTVDVYREKAAVQKNFFRLLLYVSCFPQLIAGPIVNYSDVAEEIADRHTTVADFGTGMRRFFIGLGKKALLANICGAALEHSVLAGGAQKLTVLGAWFTALMYAFQLYYDFSAYSDMAIGLGQVIGFRYKENFVYPYVSRSPSDFWRRWHISLGSFFREYVYIPLGGNRRGRARTILNLFIVWALTGLWHGASWNFVLWGLYWFLLQQIDKAVPEETQKRIPVVLRVTVTFLLAIIGWVLFYYTDLQAAVTHLGALFGIGVSGFLPDETTSHAILDIVLYLPVVFIAALPIVPWVKERLAGRKRPERALDIAATVFAAAVGLLSVLYLVGQSFNPFIYFRF